MSSVCIPATPAESDRLTDGFQLAAPSRPVRSSWRLDAPVAVVMMFANLRLDGYDRLMASLDLTARGSGLPGCLSHWATGVREGVWVTEVWRNIKLFDFFLREDVLPTLTALRLPDPEVSVFPVHHFWTEGAVLRNHSGPGQVDDG